MGKVMEALKTLFESEKSRISKMTSIEEINKEIEDTQAKIDSTQKTIDNGVDNVVNSVSALNGVGEINVASNTLALKIQSYKERIALLEAQKEKILAMNKEKDSEASQPEA